MISVDELMGKMVMGSNAYTLGIVTGAELDKGNWQITNLHVKLTDEATRELGFQKPRFGSVTVHVPVSIVQAVGDIINLSKGIRELKDVVKPKKT